LKKKQDIIVQILIFQISFTYGKKLHKKQQKSSCNEIIQLIYF